MKVRFNDNLRREAEEYVFRSRVHGRMVYSVPYLDYRPDGEYVDFSENRIEYRTEVVLTYEFDVVDDPNDDRFFICTYPYEGLVIFKGHVELIREYIHHTQREWEHFDYIHQGQNDIIEEWSRHVAEIFNIAIPSPVSTSFEEQEKKRAWNAELDRIFDD
jgi:hypothetical protein